MSVDSGLNANAFRSAISRRDAASLADQLTAHNFVLIHVQDGSDPEDDLGALTADLNGHPYLVAFSSQDHATSFVQARSDVFDQDDEVGGFLVDGETLLDYLTDAYGLLINPDSKAMCQVDSELVADVLDELGLE